MTAAPRVRIATPDGRTPVVFDWPISSFCRWGIHGLNLALAMSAHPDFCPIAARPFDSADCVLDPLRQVRLDRLAEESAGLWQMLPGPAQPMAEINGPLLLRLGPDLTAFSARDGMMPAAQPAIGMAFLKHTTISAEGRARAERLGLIVAGSRWTEHVLRANGIVATTTVVPGVDTALFHPGPKAGHFGGRFVIFSGGDLGFRSGHDLVLQAFKQFHSRHPDSLLLTAWQRVPDSAPTDEAADPVQRAIDSGIPSEAIVSVGTVPNIAMPHVVREADVGLFPNRCEGGTNAVAMECMACGIPVILSANTGHIEVLEAGDVALPLTRQGKIEMPDQDTRDWGESDVDEILARLEQVWTDREAARALGLRGAGLVTTMACARQTDRLLRAILPFLP